MNYQKYHKNLRELIDKLNSISEEKDVSLRQDALYEDQDLFSTLTIPSEDHQAKPKTRILKLERKKSEDKNKETIREHFLDYYDDFFDDLETYKDRTNEETDYSYFESYWPTYLQMDKKQSDYYFYWREKVLSGKKLQTDTGYLKLLFYEILNGYHYDSNEEGLKLLEDLYNNYANDFPQIKKLLFTWIVDFILLNDFKVTEQSEIFNNFSGDKRIQNLFLKLYLENPKRKWPIKIIDMLTVYDLTKSKVFKENKDLVEEIFPRILPLINYFLLRTEETDLYQKFFGKGSEKMSFPVYLSAITPISGKRISIDYIDYRSNEDIKEYLTQIIRFSENILREHLNIRGRLRVSLKDKKLEKYLRSYILNLLNNQNPQPYTDPVYNEELIQNLRIESDKVQSVLEVEEEDPDEPEITETISVLQEPVKSEEIAYFDPKRLEPEFLELINNLNNYQQELLISILDNEASEQILQSLSQKHNILPDLIIEEINEQALELIDDILIQDDFEIDEDYREILEKSRI